MQKRGRCIFFTFLTIVFVLSFSSNVLPTENVTFPNPSSGTIYLYGEHHGVEWILKEEIELWRQHYDDEKLRHLFIEFPFYTGEFLNIWMYRDNDEILDDLYLDWEGTACYSPYVYNFFKTIKKEFPETVFHGTDVGHQYLTTGRRYLAYLEENGLQESEEYVLAQEIIRQGQHFYAYSDGAYRENKMVENFIREFDKLAHKSVVGFYGAAHTDLDTTDYMTGAVPSMASQLKQRYERLYSRNLALDTDPLRSERVEIGGTSYQAQFLGKQDLTGFKNFAFREFWRLENAYDDFKDGEKTGDVLPYNNYPTEIGVGQVFRIDYTMTDGSTVSLYYRTDGGVWNGLPVTEEFVLEEGGL